MSIQFADPRVTDDADLLINSVDTELIIDDTTIATLAPLPTAPGTLERLRRLEGERRDAFSQMHRMVADIGALKSEQDRWVREVGQVQADALYRLAVVAEFRNGGGSGKVLRIGVMSALLAHGLGCEEYFCDRLQAAAPLHDVGEIALPESLLQQVAAFSEMERELMRSHCLLGHSLLAGSLSPEIAMAADIALGHHESFDGGGYPNRLAGQAIPLAARIVAVVDCFDALTMRRPYRPAHSTDVAADIVMAASGAQFDPAVIEVFRRIKEALLLVRWLLDDLSPSAESEKWLGKPPEPGFWKRFL